MTQQNSNSFIHSPVCLIGFMGSGKSTLARCLAASTGLSLFSTDEAVVRLTGRSIAEVFAEDGEAAFRGFETRVLRALKQRTKCGDMPCIVDCGGGIILSEENRALLKEIGTVIWLHADADTILRHLGDSAQNGERPLLASTDLRGTVQRLLAARNSLYEQAADLVLEAADQTPQELVCELRALLMQKRGNTHA